MNKRKKILSLGSKASAKTGSTAKRLQLPRRSPLVNVPSAKETTAIPFVIFNASDHNNHDELYELAATDDKQVFSPYCWRIRGLASQGIVVQEYSWRMTEKDRIAFAEQNGYLCLWMESKNYPGKILEYLDEQYPTPSLEMNQQS